MNWKNWWQSKTIWAAIITALVGAYQMLAPGQGWPDIPEGVLIMLAGAGLYGLRTANANVGATPDRVVDNAPALPLDKGVPLDAPVSGLEALPLSAWEVPGLDAPAPPARGFLSGGMLALGLDAVVSEFLDRLGIEATPARLLKIGARLAVMVPDLADGSAYLSETSRNRVLGVLMDLKAEGGLT